MSGAFLNVETSLTGRRWVGPDPAAERAALTIAQRTGLPELVARILAQRGVAPEDASGFLAPTLRDLTPDPAQLRDMDVAADRLIAAVRGAERIAIFGDYDVDGAASSAMLARWLRAQGRDATVYIPDRIGEGYGPNVPAMEGLAGAHELIVCLDCGTLSHEPIAAVRGTDVLVIDHHLGGETLPDALAVVNPNRQDEANEIGHLCAAGVLFLVLIAANQRLRAAGETAPDLLGLLDLAALATVADVAPLTGFNRALVRQGLTVMARRSKPGLAALADAARMNAAPAAYHLGFLLGPRINAGGRIGQSDLGAKLLMTEDPHEAAAIAEKLEALNTERREIEAQVRAAAEAQAEERGVDGPLVWAAGEGWHPGVVGIVAARLRERFNRPAVVIGLTDGAGAGSGRSVPRVDLGAAIATLAREALIERGGGHKMAAGLTITEAQLIPAMTRLSALLAKSGAGDMGAADLRLDGALAPGAATMALVETLEQAGPFGAAAPAPRFAIPAARIAFSKRAGDTHLRLTIAGDGPGKLDAMAFRAFETALGPALSDPAAPPMHLAGRLEIDDWGGRRKVKFRVEDAAAT